MQRIVLCLLKTHASGSCCAMMSVGNIQSRDSVKCCGNLLDKFWLINHPNLMTEALCRCELVDRRFG